MADVDTAVNFPAQPTCTGGGVDDVAAVVKITMRSGAAGFKMSDSLGRGRFAHFEDIETFRRWLSVGAAPTGSNAFKASDHFVVGDLDLNRPGIFRAGNINAKFRRCRVGNIDHTPAAVPSGRRTGTSDLSFLASPA